MLELEYASRLEGTRCKIGNIEVYTAGLTVIFYDNDNDNDTQRIPSNNVSGLARHECRGHHPAKKNLLKLTGLALLARCALMTVCSYIEQDTKE